MSDDERIYDKNTASSNMENITAFSSLFSIGRHYYAVSMRSSADHTNEEKPGSGARDRAMLFITICVPFRLTTALDASWSESVKLE